MKKLSVILLGMLAGLANAQDVKVQAGEVYINGNYCKSVQSIYKEYFKLSKEEVKDIQSGKLTGVAIDDNGLGFRTESTFPAVFGFDAEAQAQVARDSFEMGGKFKYDKRTSTCTVLVIDMKGVK